MKEYLQEIAEKLKALGEEELQELAAEHGVSVSFAKANDAPGDPVPKDPTHPHP